MAERHATVTWRGTLTEGTGTIDTGSGVLQGSPVTWASRMETPQGKTSPEELLAASQAECYAMVLTNKLSNQGNVPDELRVTATCTVERKPEGGIRITRMDLDVQGTVSGVDEEAFRRLADEAEADCPVSQVLRGNLETSVNARLT